MLKYLIALNFICAFAKICMAIADKRRRLWHVGSGCAILLVAVILMGENL